MEQHELVFLKLSTFAQDFVLVGSSGNSKDIKT